MGYMRSGVIVEYDKNTGLGVIFDIQSETDYAFDLYGVIDGKLDDIRVNTMVTFVKHGNSIKPMATDIQVVKQRKAV